MTELSSADQAEIRDVLHTYCRLVDLRRAADVPAAAYTEDGVHENGRSPVSKGREAIGARFTGFQALLSGTAHVVSNIEIFDDGNKVTSSTYVTAWHWMAEPGAPPVRPADFCLVAVYEDSWTHTADGWRIAHRKFRPLGAGCLAVGELPEQFRGFGGVTG